MENTQGSGWVAGHVLCLNCGEDHVAAFPYGAEPLSCPYCDEGACVLEDGAGYGERTFTLAKEEEQS